MGKLYQKYSNKKVNAEKEGIDFNLSFDDYKYLLSKADITVDDVGVKGYHLSRYNDQGPYEIGNCRFVHYLVNLSEKKISDKSRKSSRKNLIKLNKSRSWEEKSRIGKIGGKRSHELGYGTQKLSLDEVNRRIEIINNSGINLNKFGWVTKVSKLLDISHTQVRRFIKEHYKGSFYERKIRV